MSTPKNITDTRNDTIRLQVANVNVYLNQWFHKLIDERKTTASITISLMVFLSLFIFSTLLQFSLLHPINFITDTFNTWTSWKVWLTFLLCGASTFISFRFGLLQLGSAQQLHPLTSTWMGANLPFVLIFVLLYHLNILALFNVTGITLVGSIAKMAFFLSLYGGGFFQIIVSDHRLHFDEQLAEKKLPEMLRIFCADRLKLITMNSLTLAAKIYGVTYLTTLVLSFPFHSWAILWTVIDLRLHLIIVLSLTSTLLMISFARTIVLHYVMKPINFLLPPPYAVATPSQEQLTTLIHALASKDSFLKLFAGYDLRRIGRVDSTRRNEIFSLSQPGGHPRNWASVVNSCLEFLEQTERTIQSSAPESSLPSELVAESPDRNLLFMPPTIRERMSTSAILRQNKKMQTAQLSKKNVLAGIIPAAVYKKVFGWIIHEKQTITPCDADIAIYFIEGISLLIVKAREEDQYGVVQRDIHNIVSHFILVVRSIDKYFRIKNVRPLSKGPDAPIYHINHALLDNIGLIAETYSPHLRELKFTQEEIAFIERHKKIMI